MYITFNNSYARLPENFYTKVLPIPVKSPKLGCFNFPLATELGLDYRNTPFQEIADIFSGNKIVEGSEPVALVYAGHQFGHFVPQLGDGRAILLGEIFDKNGIRHDIQLKGSGQTPYSRQGDGRAALGPMLREYIVSEAMQALGIKTTRSLALVTTGESVYRDTILPGAILTRIAKSHLRIGTFEYFAAQGDLKSLKILADYTIERLYPELKEVPNPYLSLLKSFQAKLTSLIVDWIGVGFIHGVMNTDNTALSGETLDYGPCAFLDEYHAHKVFSSIDYYSRYAFYNQPSIAFWNLKKLGKCFAPLIEPNNPLQGYETIKEAIQDFKQIYEAMYLEAMAKKIGIVHPQEKDRFLIEELLNIMQQEALDYTLTFRYLSYAVNNTPWIFDSLFTPPPTLNLWLEKWYNRLQENNLAKEEISRFMLSMNPAIIPRNHQLAKLIKHTEGTSNFSRMHEFIKILSTPYQDDRKELLEYMRAPTPTERVCQTFCGT